MLLSRNTKKWILLGAIALTFYRFRWGILGIVNIGPPQKACSDIEALNAYLDTGGNPSAYLRRTPLIVCAARTGAYDVVSELIDQGADIDAQVTNIPLPIMFEDIGSTALYISILEGHTEIAKLLFENGADINLSGAGGSPLDLVIELNQSQLLESFLEFSSTVYEFEEDKIFKAARDGNLEIFRVLLEADVRLEEVYERALAVAASEGNIEVVKFLFNEGISIDGESPSTGLNGLHRSAKFNHVEILRFLISAGADVNSVDNEGNTPLHYAAMSNNVEIAKVLIDSGADIDLENNEGMKPLEIAAGKGSFEVVNLLGNSGASI